MSGGGKANPLEQILSPVSDFFSKMIPQDTRNYMNNYYAPFRQRMAAAQQPNPMITSTPRSAPGPSSQSQAYGPTDVVANPNNNFSKTPNPVDPNNTGPPTVPITNTPSTNSQDFSTFGNIQKAMLNTLNNRYGKPNA